MSIKYIKHVSKLFLAIPIVLDINSTFAGGFQMHEQNASLGDVHAGYSVDTSDASINFFNPAGLTDILDSITTTSAVTVANNIYFSGNSRVNTYPEPDPNFYKPIIGSGKVSANGLHVIPGAHFARPITENLVFGFSVASPFAAELEWDKKQFTKFNTTLNGIKTINISPSLGYKVNNSFSLGFGPEIQYVEMDINKMVGSNVYPMFFDGIDDPRVFDSYVSNKLTHVGLTWHAGILFKPLKNAKIGASYRHGITHKAKGISSLKGNLAGQIGFPSPENENKTKSLKSDIRIPSTLAVSGQLSPYSDLDFVSTLVYTKWSVVQTIELENVATALVNEDKNPIFLKLVSNNMNFKDTFTLLTGAHWKYNNNLLLKLGFGYDQTPTNDNERDLKIPDGDRFLLGFGGNYKYSQDLNIEAGYMFVKVRPTKIHKKIIIEAPKGGDPSLNPGEINEIYGRASGYANLLGIQTTFSTEKIMKRFI